MHTIQFPIAFLCPLKGFNLLLVSLDFSGFKIVIKVVAKAGRKSII